MRRAATILTILASLTLAPEVHARTAAGEEHGVEAFRREVKELTDLLRLPGISVAVVHDGRIVYRQHEGYADLDRKTPIRDDSIFWLASVTKTFTAVLMMQYEQEGRLSLDDPLIKYPFTSVGFLPQRIDPNVRLKHVLSHTSERVPGDSFVYHGGRYNFVYGVFEKLSGLKFPQAFTQELHTRILQPLGMESTLAGYPEGGDAPAKARIVTPYAFDASTRAFVVNRQDHGVNTAYPATGLLSSVQDLAALTTALDGNRLLSRGHYERMTAPFVTNKGRLAPYGVGWFTQRFAGLRLHWAYGLGNSDSSLLLRVPDRRLTLIVLSNSRFASEPFVLGGGHALRSPFVTSFLKHFVLQDDGAAIDYGGDVAEIRAAFERRRVDERYSIHLEELLAQALARSFAENRFGTKTGQAEALVKLLFEVDRDVFTQNDPAVMDLLSQQSGEALDEAADLFIRSYHASGQFHPWILYSIARRFERKGDVQNALKYDHLLADTPGFEEQEDKIEACAILASHYTRRKDFDKAREYAWRAFVYTRQAGYNDAAILQQIDELNRRAGTQGAQGS